MTYGTTIGGRREINLRFSDDTITLLSTSKEKLLALLKRVKEASKSENHKRQRSWWRIKAEQGNRTSFKIERK